MPRTEYMQNPLSLRHFKLLDLLLFTHLPVEVITTMAFAWHFCAASTAAMAVVCVQSGTSENCVVIRKSWKISSENIAASASLHI